MSNGYVGDGYTLDGYVAAAPEAKSGQRLYEAIEFTYRPAVRTEVVRHDAEVSIATRDEATDPDAAVKGELLACKFVAGKVTSWSVKDRLGDPVPITQDSMARLNATLFSRVYLIVRGSQVSDPKPPATEPATSDAEQVKN